MMDERSGCQSRREEIAALVMGELNPPAAERVREHLEGCKTCRNLHVALVAEERAVRSAFEAMARSVEPVESRLAEQLSRCASEARGGASRRAARRKARSGEVVGQRRSLAMYRFLIGVAAAVVLIAIGAVVALGFFWGEGRSSGDPTKPPQAGAVSVAEEPRADEPSVTSDTVPPARPSPKEATGAEPKKGPQVDRKEDRIEAPQVDQEDSRTRVARILEDFTEEDERVLMRELQKRNSRRRREQMRRRLPSDGFLRRLQYSRNETLKLSSAQVEQIEAARQTMRPQIEAALQDIWAQQDQVRQETAALGAEGRGEEARETYAAAAELQKQEWEIKKQLDETYRTMLSGILSPEQMEAVPSQATRHWGKGSSQGGLVE